MHWIPDVPKIIEDQIERESLITQRALWEAKPEIKAPSPVLNLESLLLSEMCKNNNSNDDDSDYLNSINIEDNPTIVITNPT